MKAQLESFIQCLPEMKLIFIDHHKDLCTYPDRMPLDPMYEMYFEGERNGRLRLITIRSDEKELIAYYLGWIGPAAHYQSTPTDNNDIFYVKKDRRFHGVGKFLFDSVREDNIRRGIKYCRVETKMFAPVEEFMKSQGYEKTAEVYTMWLGA